jgi:hypothetical protein
MALHEGFVCVFGHLESTFPTLLLVKLLIVNALKSTFVKVTIKSYILLCIENECLFAHHT